MNIINNIRFWLGQDLGYLKPMTSEAFEKPIPLCPRNEPCIKHSKRTCFKSRKSAEFQAMKRAGRFFTVCRDCLWYIEK